MLEIGHVTVFSNRQSDKYLSGADFELEKKIDKGFSDDANFLIASKRISSLMSNPQGMI